MTTLTATYHRPHHIPVIGIMICVLLVVVGTTLSHAITKHGEDALIVRQCINDKGALQTWYNQENNHCIEVAQVNEFLYGLRVLFQRCGQWEECTAFLKNKFTRLDQVENYLRNSGAVRVK